MVEHPESPLPVADGAAIGHLSDPHLTTPVVDGLSRLGLKRALSYLSWRRKRRFRHRAEVLAQVVADIRTLAPEHLLVSGDLTHLGLPGECREALRWLESLDCPDRVSVVPGNHDVLVADDWRATAGLWHDFFAADAERSGLAATCESDRARGAPGRSSGRARLPGEGAFPFLRRRGPVDLIGINTAVPTAPLFADGRVGAAQLGRLGELLDGLGRAGRFRLVFLHHSPLPEGHGWRKRLRDAGALLEVLRAAGAELVVHGHGHHEALTTVPTAAGPMLVVGAPSASLAGDFAAGWNLYRVAADPEGWSVRIDRRRHGPGGMTLAGSTEHRLGRGCRSD